MRASFRVLLLGLLAALNLPAFALAADEHRHGGLPSVDVQRIDPAVASSLTTGRAVARDCTARVLSGRRGVATTTYTAPADGQVTFRLRGSGDWDLAVFDSAGELVASSAAFKANEVAQVSLRQGARLLVQACRVAGGGRSVTLTSQLARVD